MTFTYSPIAPQTQRQSDHCRNPRHPLLRRVRSRRRRSTSARALHGRAGHRGPGFGIAPRRGARASNEGVPIHGVSARTLVRSRIPHRWFNTTYTFNGFRFDNDAVYHNNRLPGVAPHLIRGELLYNGSRGFYVGPNVEWTPQPFYADNANTLTANPYALLNVRAGVDLVRGWSIWAESRNLTDKAYISTAAIVDKGDPAGAIFNPGYGRAIYTGVRFTP